MPAISSTVQLQHEAPKMSERPLGNEFLGLVAAIGGRGLWRLWAPLAAYAAVGSLSWIWWWFTEAPPGTSSYFSATVLVLATPLWVALLWLWGTRFALTMGYSRWRVFVFTWTLSALGPFVLVVICIGAQLVEHRIGPLSGYAVWAVSNVEDLNATTVDYFLNSPNLTYYPQVASPLLIPVALGAIGWLRGGMPRGLVVFALATAIMFALFAGASALDFWLEPRYRSTGLWLPFIIGNTAGGFVGWRMFRRIPA